MAYKALSTANLPDPAIDPAKGSTPDQYFDVGIWTGDGVNGRTIANLYEHTPDWVWIKNRSAAIDHNVADVLRGWKELYPNLTNAEGSQQMNAPTNDGLSGLPASNGYNNNGNAYVSWVWKANGSGVSNTDGDITSTVSANTESGFSIVSYTGSGSAQSVGHGLNASPSLLITKNRTTGGENSVWLVWHQDRPNGYQYLNSASAGGNTGGFHDTSLITTSTFGYNSTGASSTVTNASGDNYITYCFHSVEGFSKFSSYVGNGSSDGVFVYTGFRPAFVMIKNISASSTYWIMFDVERDTHNVMDTYLQAQASNAEASFPFMDFLSNGFKHRHTSSHTNTSGQTYIYMAFAEQPFKFSNSR
jgi:hypothetical protein